MSSQVVHSAVDERLFSALDNVGIAYEVRTSDRGLPYAGFRIGHDSRVAEGLTSVTALLEEGVLRLTVHDIARDAAHASMAANAAALPLGALYAAPETRAVELSVGVHVGAAPDLGPMLRILLGYLHETRRHLEGRAECPAMPPLAVESVIRKEDIGSALDRLGHATAPIEAGVSLELPLDAQGVCRLEMVALGGGWLLARGRLQPALRVAAAERELALLQRLQRWTAAGRYLRDESGELSVEVPTPDLAQPRAAAISWTASQAVLMLRTAAKHLGR